MYRSVYTIGDTIYFDDYVEYIECKTCERDLPNKNYITKNGCLWCDKENK
ncbi:hypothetical protein LCGC14_1725000, partial [marine sediment metagenome]